MISYTESFIDLLSVFEEESRGEYLYSLKNTRKVTSPTGEKKVQYLVYHLANAVGDMRMIKVLDSLTSEILSHSYYRKWRDSGHEGYNYDNSVLHFRECQWEVIHTGLTSFYRGERFLTTQDEVEGPTITVSQLRNFLSK